MKHEHEFVALMRDHGGDYDPTYTVWWCQICGATETQGTYDGRVVYKLGLKYPRSFDKTT